MRRENRKNRANSNMSIYITGGVLVLAIAAFIITFVVYSNKLDSDSYGLDSEYLAQYTNQNTNITSENTTTASSSIGKTIEESKNSLTNNTETKDIKEDNKVEEIVKNEDKKETSKTNTKKDPVFSKPIEGDISKEFAKDNLVYSETLKEWTVHLGVDIKAEKATIVKAAADGKVKYIKNDPIYGLSIIIEHSNGFQTLYANLLTTEFVSEGEEVKAGQTIATIGESGVYEIVDEPHLHFELIKDNENINPADYIKFE